MYIRKKGSVLILMLLVVALLLVLGTSLLMLNTGTYKLEMTNDVVSRINYVAESGIKVTLPKIKNLVDSNEITQQSKLDDINNYYKDHPIETDNIRCNVIVGFGIYNNETKTFDNSSNSISIVSSATYNPTNLTTNISNLNGTNIKLLASSSENDSSSNSTGQITKTVIATIQFEANNTGGGTTTPGDGSGGNQDTDTPNLPVINPLTQSCLNVYGNINNSYNDFSVGNGNNTNLNINGSAYIQAYSSNFASNLNITNGNLISLSKSKINFNNNSSNASISGKVFLQSDDDIILSQNIKAGTVDNPSGYTILSDKTINFNNNSTTSNIYGDIYVNGKNGVTMSQTLNVNKGNLNIISNNGDITLSGNSNPTTVSGWISLLGNNITIARNTTIGTELNQSGFKVKADKYINLDKNSTTTTVFGDAYLKGITGITLGQNLKVSKNITAITDGGIDLGNTDKNINGNSYIRSNYTSGNVDKTDKSGIYNASYMNVGGYSALISNNTITDESGSKDNINGTLYIQSERDLLMANQLNKVGGLYSVVSNNGKITFKNDINNVSGGIYVKAKDDINIDSSVHNIKTNNDFTMIGNNIAVPWINFYLSGNTFLKAPTKFHIDTNDNNLGNAYIETNNFEHNSIKASSLRTFVPNISDNNVSPSNFTKLTSPEAEPPKPSVPSEPAEIQLPSKSIRKVEIPNISSTVKNGIQYNHWDNSYSGIQSIIVKGSNIDDIANAINDSQGNNYKVIIIDGNCTLDNNAWSKINSVNGNINIDNTIIYCTGKLIIDNPGKIINFNHSTVFSNGFNFNYNTINMTAINQPGGTVTFTNDMASYVNTLLTNSIDNYELVTNLPSTENSNNNQSTNGSTSDKNYTISYSYY